MTDCDRAPEATACTLSLAVLGDLGDIEAMAGKERDLMRHLAQ